LPPELLLLAQICTKSQRSPDSLVGIGGVAPEEREAGREGKRREGSGGKGGERVPECPDPELASLQGIG